jgi:transcriptional regulator with XRE-family HTH domain
LKEVRNLAGPLLRKLRVSHGLSQAELAARCQRYGWDASREIINHIEMRIRVLREYEVVALAKALNVSSLKLLPSEKEVFRKLGTEKMTSSS